MKSRLLPWVACTLVALLVIASRGGCELDASATKLKSTQPKVLLIWSKGATESGSTLALSRVDIRELAGRSFIVGKIIHAIEASELLGRVAWIPTDEVLRMVEFPTEQEAIDFFKGGKDSAKKDAKAEPAKSSRQPKINWRTDYNAALHEAAERKLPLLIYFRGPARALSEKLEREMFASDLLARLLKEKFVLLKVDEEEEKKLFERMAIESPTVLVADSQKKILRSLQGFRGSKQLYSELEATLKGLKESTRFNELKESKLSPAAAADLVWEKLGLRLRPVEAEVVSRVNEQLHGGLEVTAVDPRGAAASAGIQRGDILVGLHQWEVLTLDNVAYIAGHADLSSFAPLSYYVVRNGKVRRGSFHAAELK